MNLRYGLLIASLLLPAWPVGVPQANAASNAKSEFQCKGIGVGRHTKGLTESECVKRGGIVVKEDLRNAPAQQSFRCRGIGKGRRFPGLTKEQCVKMGGKVEKR